MQPVLEKVGPSPHYLTEVAVLDDEVLAVAVFPTSDKTIGDRVDHANVSHLYFGIWNAAHLLCQKRGLVNPVTTTGSYKCLQKIPPDTSVYLLFRCHHRNLGGEHVLGEFRARYTDHSGKKLALFEGRFKAQKVLSPG